MGAVTGAGGAGSTLDGLDTGDSVASAERSPVELERRRRNTAAATRTKPNATAIAINLTFAASLPLPVLVHAGRVAWIWMDHGRIHRRTGPLS